MKYARAAWKQERASWRAVIQLNLIRSIIMIVETIQSEMEGDNTPSSPINPNADNSTRQSLDTIPSESEEASILTVPLTHKHQLLKLRLGPLRRVEADLKRRLGAGTEEIVSGAANAGSLGGRSRSREFGVRAWKDALGASEADGSRHWDEATEVIVSCKEDMMALWTDEAVKAVLTKRNIRVQDSAGLLVAFPLLSSCISH
jgi:hypothetical protein